MLTLIVALAFAPGPNPARLASWGAEAVEKMQRELYVGGSYVDVIGSKQGSPPTLVSLSSLTTVVSALTAAAAYDEKYIPTLRKSVAAATNYWNPAPPVAGYNSSPLPGATLRSYGENAQMALALSQAASVLKSSETASSASKALDFVFSGYRKPDGIYDLEGDASDISSFAGAATVLAILGQSSNSASNKAISLYEWVRHTFRDPATNLFKASNTQDELKASDAALMIDSASYLYTATHETKYVEEARNLETASQTQWGTLDGKIRAPLPAAEMLVESWLLRIQLAPGLRETYGASVQAFSAIEWLHRNERDGNGHYGNSWETPVHGRLDSWRLIDQAAAARVYFVGASAAKLQKEG